MKTPSAIRRTQYAPQFRAVLFDLDGTLLDTLTDLADAMNASLVHFGFEPHPVEAYKYFVGDAVETETRRALPDCARDIETIKKVAEFSEQIYNKCWHKNTVAYPGIPELLSTLARRGLHTAVLSNKPDHFTKIMVEKILPDWRFEIVQGALPDVPIKPDPTSALQIAKHLNIPPEQFLYLGDTNTDMQTAVAASMCPIGALWGFRPADELIKSGAKSLVAHPLDILKLLGPPENTCTTRRLL
jgi:phosphoglycolate phosphatase